MAMVTVSVKKNREYQRKFDHEEAQLLYRMGWNPHEIAREFGVSPQAVLRVVDPEVRERMAEHTSAWLMSGVCVSCGGPRTRVARRLEGQYASTDQCRTCWGISMRTRGRLDEMGQLAAVHCNACKTWKDPGEFPRDKNDALGLHEQCRACNTKARQDYRERHKVPCTFCGEPCLPASEKRRASKGLPDFPFPRCRACFHDWQRVHRAGVRARLLAENPGINPKRGTYAERTRLATAQAIVDSTR